MTYNCILMLREHNFPQDILFMTRTYDSFDTCTIIWYLYNNEILHQISYNWEKRRQREIWTLISKTTAFSLIYLRVSLCHSSNAFFAWGLKSIIAFLWGEQSRMTEDKYGLWKRERKRQIQRDSQKQREKRESVRKTLNTVSKPAIILNMLAWVSPNISSVAWFSISVVSHWVPQPTVKSHLIKIPELLHIQHHMSWLAVVFSYKRLEYTTRLLSRFTVRRSGR